MMEFPWSRRAGAVLVLALALGAVRPALAVPLDGPACEQLQVQLDALRAEGATADMARGPEWARANLPPDRLQRIGTLLQVEEQLNFRCGLAKTRITLPTTVEGGEEELPGPGEATVEGSGGTIVLPLRAPPAPGSPAKAAAASAPPKAAVTRPAPAKKATLPRKKPQPKADDAYRPPPRPPQTSGNGG